MWWRGGGRTDAGQALHGQIAQEQAPALARIRALEQRAAERERIERERQAQALREQQAEDDAIRALIATVVWRRSMPRESWQHLAN